MAMLQTWFTIEYSNIHILHLITGQAKQASCTVTVFAMCAETCTTITVHIHKLTHNVGLQCLDVRQLRYGLMKKKKKAGFLQCYSVCLTYVSFFCFIHMPRRNITAQSVLILYQADWDTENKENIQHVLQVNHNTKTHTWMLCWWQCMVTRDSYTAACQCMLYW